MGGWMDGCVDGWIDMWMDGYIYMDRDAWMEMRVCRFFIILPRSSNVE